MTNATYEDWGASMPQGIGAHFYSQVESTNALAKDLAAKGNKGPLWLIAGEQLSGRGRQGRIWSSKPGNLYCSLLFAPSLKLEDMVALPFIVSLAVRDTAIKLGVAPTLLTCKWPNDVLLNSKKLSGILIESSAKGRKSIDFLVIGIGMNLVYHPNDTAFGATDIFEATGVAIDVHTAISVLAEAVKTRLDAWDTNDFSSTRGEWLSHAWGFGVPREIRTAKGSFTGTLDSINEHGAVNVILDDGSEKIIYVADIFPVGNGNSNTNGIKG